MGIPDDGLFHVSPIRHFNGSPGAAHSIMRQREDGIIAPEKLMWQYLSPWAAKSGKPPAINARLDKLLGGYYRLLMTRGRIVLPVDGWFEWTGEKGHKQAWFIRAKSGDPLFLAALTDVIPGKDVREKSGFVVVTDAAAGGMVDMHDRRPVVLDADDAKLWMDPDLDFKAAEQIARTSPLPEDHFEWHEVSKEVNKVGHHAPTMVEPDPD
ncbi:SOS response-associated peptidase family protein [soil metagenome]